MLYDKDKWNGNARIDDKINSLTYPFVIKNSQLKEKSCQSPEEIIQWLDVNPNVTILGSVLRAKINPSLLISDDSLAYIKLYQDIKTWGIGFFYKDARKMPNKTYQALNIIESTMKQHEMEQYKSLKKDNKNG